MINDSSLSKSKSGTTGPFYPLLSVLSGVSHHLSHLPFSIALVEVMWDRNITSLSLFHELLILVSVY
jgi:hypothetical protein